MKKKMVILMISVLLSIALCAGCATSEAAAQATVEEIESQGAEASDIEIPSGIMANSTRPDLIRIRWNKVNGASGYEVYRAAEESGEYTQIATELESAEKVVMSTLDRDIGVGTQYYYKVRAFMDNDDEMVYSEYSGVTSCHTKPASTTSIAVSGGVASTNKTPENTESSNNVDGADNSADHGDNVSNIAGTTSSGSAENASPGNSATDGSSTDNSNTSSDVADSNAGKTWHDAEYEDVWVVDVPAGTKQVPATLCNDCNADITGNTGHIEEHILNDPNAKGSYREGTVTVEVVEQGHWEKKLKREAGYY